MPRPDSGDDAADRPTRRKVTDAPIVIGAVFLGGVLLAGALACAGLGWVWTRVTDDVAEGPAAAETPAAVVYPPDPWENPDEADRRLRLAGQEEADRAGVEAAAESFRRLPAADRVKIDQVRVVLRARPPVELTDVQRGVLSQHAAHFGRAELATYFRHLANQRGANGLVKRLAIPPDLADEFKETYAAIPQAWWPQARAVLESAAANGVRSLRQDDWNYLGVYNLVWALEWAAP
jgi:hypothetical protein